MSGLLDLYSAQAGPMSNPLVQPPSTPGERFSAEFDSSTAPDRWFNLNASRRDWRQKVVDELHAETGQTFANPYGAVTPEEMMRLGNQPAVIEERRNKLIEANRALRETKPDAINAEGIDTFIGVEGEAARQKAAGLVNTGNGLAAFAGGMAAPTPENVLGLFIPPARAVFGAVTVGRSFLYGVGREALFQGGAMAGLTAATEGLDVLARTETGTAPHLGEVVGNIAMGAAGGAVLGGAFHALHAGPKALWERWNKLPEAVRENAPLEVRDAFKAIEAETIYGSTNRLGLPWVLHERYQGNALDAVMRGTAVRLEELRPGDTPLTGLATILRQAPDQISVEGLQRGAARVAALPDAELEPFARQIKPKSFTALDAVNAKLQALDERAAAIRAEAEQLGMPDVIDLDTAALINDAETNLRRKDLTRRERVAYEHQRDTWLQSVDPNGALKQELARLRKDFFPEHGPALAEIAAERKGLERQQKLAQGEAQREVDFLRSKLDQIETAGPDAPVSRETLGGEPADVAKALEAAEFNRQIRMVRETPLNPAAENPARNTAAAAKDGVQSPEQLQAIKAAADAVMETPGSLGDFKRAAKRELEALDLELSDARAAAACVNNGGGIP